MARIGSGIPAVATWSHRLVVGLRDPVSVGRDSFQLAHHLLGIGWEGGHISTGVAFETLSGWG